MTAEEVLSSCELIAQSAVAETAVHRPSCAPTWNTQTTAAVVYMALLYFHEPYPVSCAENITYDPGLPSMSHI